MVVYFGGLPRPDLGLRSYLLFNSTIKNLENAKYFESWASPSSCSKDWGEGSIVICTIEESILLISSMIKGSISCGC